MDCLIMFNLFTLLIRSCYKHVGWERARNRADRRIAGVVNLLFPGTVQSANCLGDRLGRADRGLRPLLRRDRHPHADHLLPLQRPETYPIHLVRADVTGRAQKLDPAQHRFRPGRAILAFCRTRTYHAHHPDRSALLLVLQRRSELRLVNGPLDGRIRHRFALLQKTGGSDSTTLP